MKVKMLTTMSGEKAYYQNGKVYDFPTKKAKRLIAAKFAVETDEQAEVVAVAKKPAAKQAKKKKGRKGSNRKK